MFDKKILWGILAGLVSFDNIYSYLAITQHGMREWNPVAAYFVNITPLYYFPSILLSLGVFYAIVKFLGWLSSKDEKKNKQMIKEFVENMALTAIVIGWGLTATLFNFLTFANGFVNPEIRYNYFLYAGIIISAAYVFYSSYKFAKKNKIKNFLQKLCTPHALVQKIF